MKAILIRVLGVLVLVAAGWGAYHFFKGMSSRQTATPVTRVRQGDVVVRTFTRGELRAVRTATISAPNLFGTIQVTRLAPLGGFAREKDLIVEFDDSEVQARLEQKQLELEQLDEQIKKAQADLAIRNNQDEVDLLRARYSVRRAQLEVQRNPLLSTIDQKKNDLTLQEAQQRLKQLESDIKSKQEQTQAEMEVLRQKRQRALLEISRERQRLGQVKMLSPISGLVAIRQNRSGFSGMFGSAVPDIREGDQLQPGIQVADVLDLSELEVTARVGELDRANLREGQDVTIRLDAISDKVFNGKIKSLSGTASANIFSSDPGKKFDVTFSIDMQQLLTALGSTPEQIARIMRTAEENRRKPINSAAPNLASMLGGMAAMAGGMPGGGNVMMMGGQGGPQMMMGGGQGGQGGQDAQGGEGRRGQRGQGGPGGFGGMSDEQRQQLRAAMEKELKGRSMQDLSQEERQSLMTKLRSQLGMAGGDRKAGDAKSGDAKQGDRKGGSEGGSPMMMSFGGPGGGGRGGFGGPGGLPQLAGGLGGGNFTQKDLDNAKLPSPPGEDSGLDVLLRPGLLADVEIIVEKVANAIYVPNQAIFEADGKPVVYLRLPDGKFEPRPVKIAKRSETVSVITEGIKVGDNVAMQDPTAKAGDKKSSGKESKGGAASALPTGAAGGGR